MDLYKEGESLRISLSQEIMINIKKRGKLTNLVVKWDMAKSYDRVDQRFLVSVSEKMGFNNILGVKIWRLVENIWYSLLINDQAHGFFHSFRGVKHRDPLTLASFTMKAEVLSRALNKLFENNDFKSYGMPKWSDKINHLAYADDTIIFCATDKKSLELIMNTMKEYEK